MAEDSEEMCPICRSSSYLNPEMRFLVNPECYHKMCESCVDRIFSGGPAPCPFRGCGKILRKSRFKRQVFDDLKVEREVDVRQRVCKVFNKPEDAFTNAREYNDYLEQIEDLVFRLAGGGEDAAAAEKEIQEYEKAHKQEILDNALRMKQDNLRDEEIQSLEVERQRRLRLMAIELQKQEDELQRRQEEEAVAALAQGKDAQLAVREAADRAKQQIELLRTQYEMELKRVAQAPQRTNATLATQKPRTPFTPFAGDRQWPEPFSLQDSYFDPLAEMGIKDPTVRAGGFTAKESEKEALTLAFWGIDIDIQSEKSVIVK